MGDEKKLPPNCASGVKHQPLSLFDPHPSALPSLSIPRVRTQAPATMDRYCFLCLQVTPPTTAPAIQTERLHHKGSMEHSLPDVEEGDIPSFCQRLSLVSNIHLVM
ncbi:hypothetical protein ElyMa_006473500 [Elysia marginata]|uniref:Uncharacterized protein n=1 Tax=Elysia marginata TaxID=1093978 RepID=A0AAV4HZV6_9GAST|nr:hypothetical protein ElyMa_006473500 [Elysia marginata]